MADGIEVSQTDLQTTKTQDKTFTSETISLKSRIEGVGILTTDASGNATDTIYHYLGYAPVHLFFYNPGNTNAVKNPGAASWIDAMTNTTWGLMDNFTFTVYADTSTCRIRIQGVANTVYRYKYFIFVEKAQT